MKMNGIEGSDENLVSVCVADIWWDIITFLIYVGYTLSFKIPPYPIQHYWSLWLNRAEQPSRLTW